MRAAAGHGKPLVVTEFGCATYRGAPDRGGLAWTAVDRAARPPRLRPGIVRLDAAAFGLVRAWPDGRSEPKAAFRALAAHFLAHRHA